MDVPLSGMVKSIMSDGGYTDKNYTNHSLHFTTITRLFDQNVDTTLIKNQTGHRSNAVDGYKRISDAQQQAVSMMLCSGIKRQKTERVVRNEPSANTDDVNELSANTDDVNEPSANTGDVNEPSANTRQ